MYLQLPESDGEEKSFSQDDSLDYSDVMCGENFSTLKKGPGWNEVPTLGCDAKHVMAIDPPPEFQDSPPEPTPVFKHCLEKFALQLVAAVLEEALCISCKVTWSIPCSQASYIDKHSCMCRIQTVIGLYSCIMYFIYIYI